MPNKISHSDSFPWVSLFQLALTRGLQPETVWAMTPTELITLLDVATQSPLARSELQTLMTQYPDTPNTTTTPDTPDTQNEIL